MTKSKRDAAKKPIRRVRHTNKDGDFDVGYGKPPKAYQFKPGQSGNPTGRPKGRKNEATLVRELLDRKVAVQERGKTKRIRMVEALFRRLLEDALKGNIKTVSFLLNRYNAPSDGQSLEHLSEDDQAVLETYIRQHKVDGETGDETA